MDNPDERHKIIKLLEKAQKFGYEDMILRLANAYRYGLLGNNEDKEKAMGLYKKIADKSGLAANSVGVLYDEKMDPDNALKYFYLSAQQGCLIAFDKIEDLGADYIKPFSPLYNIMRSNNSKECKLNQVRDFMESRLEVSKKKRDDKKEEEKLHTDQKQLIDMKPQSDMMGAFKDADKKSYLKSPYASDEETNDSLKKTPRKILFPSENHI